MKLKDLIGVVPENCVVEYHYDDGYWHENRTVFWDTNFDLWSREIKAIKASDIDKGVLEIELCN